MKCFPWGQGELGQHLELFFCLASSSFLPCSLVPDTLALALPVQGTQ